MKKSKFIPQGYKRIRVVKTVDEVSTKPMGHGINCNLLPGWLKGDFRAVARYYKPIMEERAFRDGVASSLEVSPAQLQRAKKKMPARARKGAERILKAMKPLRARWEEVSLRVVGNYAPQQQAHGKHQDKETHIFSNIFGARTRIWRNDGPKGKPIFFPQGSLWEGAGTQDPSRVAALEHDAPVVRARDLPRLGVYAYGRKPK